MSGSVPTLGPREPWRHAALIYLEVGWLPIPIPPGKKHPVPVGYTGNEAKRITRSVVEEWFAELPDNSNIGTRIPDAIIVIDVDAYRNGVATLKAREKQWGELPDTWRNSARNDGAGGHMFFRLPKSALGLHWPGKIGDGVEILQPTHRYAVVWPSINPSNNQMYRWYQPGDPTEGPGYAGIPSLSDIRTEMPARWIKALTNGEAYHYMPKKKGVSEAAVITWLKEQRTGEPCTRMRRAMQQATKTVGPDGGHDSALFSVYNIIMGAQEGHIGIYQALSYVKNLLIEDITDDSRPGSVRTLQDAEEEWNRMRDGAVRTAMQRVIDSPEMVGSRCRCLIEEVDGLYRPPPGTRTDQQHARQVISWVSDQARYAKDGAVWVIKDDERWIADPSVNSQGVVALVADNMPFGEDPEDVEADDEGWKPEYSEWKLRERYETAKTMGGIAAKVQALVTTRRSSDPYVVNLHDLDKDPDILWTPNGPVDLRGEEGKSRNSDEKIDPGAVHLHCTRYSPLAGPVPAWQALCAAVWPDPAVRAWALQLLAVGLTGYSPKMFLHFYGEKDRGKTSIPTLVADLLGSYARSDLQATLIATDAQPWDRAALHGLRFGFVDETPDPRPRPTEELKKLTGGAEINAAYKNKQPFKFDPTHTLVFASNPEPNLTDPAVVARIRMLPCTGSIKGIRSARAKIGELRGRIWQQEAPGVLWQLLELAKQYVSNNDVIALENAPVVVRRAAAELRQDQDVLGEWLDMHAHTVSRNKPEEWRTVQELYDGFAKWCGQNSRTKWFLGGKDTRWLGNQLRSRKMNSGYLSRRSNSKTYWNVDFLPSGLKVR